MYMGTTLRRSAKYRLPLSSFGSSGASLSTESIGRFTDVAQKAGLNLFAMAAGVIVDDFDIFLMRPDLHYAQTASAAKAFSISQICRAKVLTTSK